MLNGMQILTVNIGVPRLNPHKGLKQTGIDKRPVDGAVAVTAPGPKGKGDVALAGDHAFNVKHHGGDYQAVYAYAREDLDRWEAELGRTLTNGFFGENLTTAGVDVNGALIGERWRIGSGLLLEVSCPRLPCTTFQGWMGIPDWIKRFTAANEPGAYLRVIEPGTVQAGDSVEVVDRPDHDVTIAVSFRAFTLEPDLLPRLLDVEGMPPADLAVVRKRLAGIPSAP